MQNPPLEKFTADTLRALEPAAKTYERSERASPGFRVRVSTTGRVTFFYRFRIGGRLREYAIGRFPDMSCGAARAVWRDLQKRVRNGEDVSATKRRSSRAEIRTVAQLAERFLVEHVERELRPSSALSVRSHLTYWLVRHYGRHRLEDFSRAHVIELNDRMLGAGLGVGANRAFSAVSTCFDWALHKGIVAESPCVGIKRPIKHEKPRDRNLTFAELAIALPAIAEARIPPNARGLLMLVALSACRPGEARLARWVDVDFDGGVWRIPQNKSDRPHQVPMTRAIRDLFIAARWRTPGEASDYVFPRADGVNPFSACMLSKLVQGSTNEERLTFGVEPFTAHDLRRTAATRLAEVKTDPYTLARLLNHAPRSVTDRVYNQWIALDDRREALERYHDRLTEELGGVLPWAVAVPGG